MKAKAISEKLTGLQQAIQSLKDPNAEQVVKELLNLLELVTSENSDLKQEVQINQRQYSTWRRICF